MRTLLVLLLLLLIPVLAHAQANAPIGQTVQFTSALPASGNGPVIDLTGTAAGAYQWVFTWVDVGTVSAGAIKLQQSTASNFASPTDCIAAQTVTAAGGPTTLTSCTAPYVRLNKSTAITGAGNVTVRLLGFPAGSPSVATLSGSLPAGTNAIGSVTDYSPIIGTGVTAYSGTGATIYTLVGTSGSTSVITASTVWVNFLKLSNITAGAITVTLTDTAGLQEETSFSIPANSTYFAIPPAAWLKFVGLKLYASAASSVNLHLSAVQ